MRIQCVGLDHSAAPLAVLERLIFEERTLEESLARLREQRLGAVHPHEPVELVILSTCNRVELYAAAPDLVFDALDNILYARSPDEVAAFRDDLYHFADQRAISHLFRVAAGLESMAVGEPQILGQVARSLEIANAAGSAGNLLNRLFQAAISAGKRVRTETELGRHASSIPTLAARFTARLVPDLRTAEITLVGAGEMARQTIEALRKRGARRFVVLNRSLQRAQELADRWQGAADTLDALPRALGRTDVLIASSSSPQVLIHPNLIEFPEKRAAGKPLVILDIAMPRNVDPVIGELPGVQLYDLDALGQILTRHHAASQREWARAEVILKDAELALIQELAVLRVVPVIVELRERLEQIRAEELEKSLRKMNGLEPEERERIAQMTRTIVNKFLHPPTSRLRRAAIEPGTADYVRITRELFSLWSDPEQPEAEC